MLTAIIQGYSPVGDMFIVALCAVCILITQANFMKNTKTTQIYKRGIVCLVVACLSNMATYYMALLNMSAIYVVLARDIYHTALLILFVFVESYLITLMGANDKVYFTLVHFSVIINFIGILLDCLSPFTHFGLQMDTAGNWVDPPMMKPFSFCYIVNIVYLGVLFLLNSNTMIRGVRRVMVLTYILGVSFVILETTEGTNSYLTLSFALPMLAALLMLHSNPYNLDTGSFGPEYFDDYLRSRHKKGQEDCFICLKFIIDEDFVMPKKLGRAFYNFHYDYVKDAVLFNPLTGVYVLAIKKEKNSDVMKSIDILMNEKFPPFYECYRIDYKIVITEMSNYSSQLAFSEMAAYFFNETKVNTALFIDGEKMEQFNRRKYIQNQLADIDACRDLDDPRVMVYCQPIVNVEKNCYDTAEALMRLDLPELGMVFPDEFIPVAEAKGYIHTLSLIILNKVCRSIREIRDAGLKLERVSVNFSVTEFDSETFVDEFEEIVSSNHIPFSSIGVELTESRNDADYENVVNALTRFNVLGTPVYLDDFGTGYSNFDRILNMQVDVIKFDRSLLMLTDEDLDYVTMVGHFAEAFNELGYKVLYEGVETEDQRNYCTALYANYLQGYLFSKPIPIGELKNKLSEGIENN